MEEADKQDPCIRDLRYVRRIKAGDMEAFEALCQCYYPLVKCSAAARTDSLCPYEDLLQEGMVGLFQAVQTYEEERGLPFAAYAKKLVKNQVAHAVERAGRKKHQPLNDAISLDAWQDEAGGADSSKPFMSTHDDLLSALIAREDAQELHTKLRKQLSAKEYAVLRLRLEGASYEYIRESLQLSPKQIDNALQRAKQKLKM